MATCLLHDELANNSVAASNHIRHVPLFRKNCRTTAAAAALSQQSGNGSGHVMSNGGMDVAQQRNRETGCLSLALYFLVSVRKATS